MAEPAFTRRKFIVGATAVGLGAAGVVATTGPPWAGGDRTISFWHLFSGGDGERMAQMLDGFAKSDTGIKVEPVTLTWARPTTRSSSSPRSAAARPTSDLAATRLGSLAPAGLVMELTPELLDKHGITEDKFEPAVWKRGQFKGKQYAIPLDTHPFVLYYNTDLAKKADLLGEDGGCARSTARRRSSTPQRVQEGLRPVGRRDRDPRRQPVAALPHALRAAERRPDLSADGKELTIENDKAERALEFMQQLGSGRKVMPTTFDYPASIANFSNATTGSMLQGEWEVTTFQAAKMKFDMTPVPNMLGKQVSQADSHAFVIPVSSSRSPERLDAALEFVAGMLNSSFTWAKEGTCRHGAPCSRVRSTASSSRSRTMRRRRRARSSTRSSGSRAPARTSRTRPGARSSG